jgi:hypothetical protein
MSRYSWQDNRWDTYKTDIFFAHKKITTSKFNSRKEMSLG